MVLSYRQHPSHSQNYDFFSVRRFFSKTHGESERVNCQLGEFSFEC